MSSPHPVLRACWSPKIQQKGLLPWAPKWSYTLPLCASLVLDRTHQWALSLFLFLDPELLEGPDLPSLYNPSAQHGGRFRVGTNNVSYMGGWMDGWMKG